MAARVAPLLFSAALLPRATARDLSIAFKAEGPSAAVGTTATKKEGELLLEVLPPGIQRRYDTHFKHVFILRSADMQFRCKISVHKAHDKNHNGIQYPYAIFFRNLMLETTPRRNIVIKYARTDNNAHTEFELQDTNRVTRVNVSLYSPEPQQPKHYERFGKAWFDNLTPEKKAQVREGERKAREAFASKYEAERKEIKKEEGTDGEADGGMDEDEEEEYAELLAAEIKRARERRSEWAANQTAQNTNQTRMQQLKEEEAKVHEQFAPEGVTDDDHAANKSRAIMHARAGEAGFTEEAERKAKKEAEQGMQG
eukprot:gene34883-16605_t